jgi:hypothetical protein
MFQAFFKPPPEEPPPIVGNPPLEWANVLAWMDWLARPGAPTCAHAYKDTIHFLLDHALLVDPMLQWLRTCGGCCGCKVLLDVGSKFPGKCR